jgi:hypothetical protein
MKKLFPRVRPDCIAKHRRVVPALQSVHAPVLLIRPTNREIGHSDELIIDDRSVSNGGTEQRKSTLLENRKQRVQRWAFYDIHNVLPCQMMMQKKRRGVA